MVQTILVVGCFPLNKVLPNIGSDTLFSYTLLTLRNGTLQLSLPYVVKVAMHLESLVSVVVNGTRIIPSLRHLTYKLDKKEAQSFIECARQ